MYKKIQIIRNLLTKEECFDLIVSCRKKVRFARVVNSEFSDERRSKVFIWLNDFELEKKFNSSNMVFQFSEYSKLNYYHWHNDFDTARSTCKRIETCVIPLNAEYRGGSFEIKDSDSIELSVGDCLRFDSKLEHRVKPVLKGIKYSLVGWIMQQNNI